MAVNLLHPPTKTTRYPTDFNLARDPAQYNLEIEQKDSEPAMPTDTTTASAEMQSHHATSSSASEARHFSCLQPDNYYQNWKSYWKIENDGQVDYIQNWSHPAGREGLMAAAHQGLSAGKLWIDGHQAMTKDGRPAICSGVCLENGDFMTVRHFLRDDLSENDRKECTAKLSDPRTSTAVVSVAAKSEVMEKHISDPTLRSVYLVAEHAEVDIAIFRIKEDEPLWDHSVKICQLTPAVDYVYKHIFCVGYSGDDRDGFLRDEYELFWNSIPTSPQDKSDGLAKARLNELLSKPKPKHNNIFLPYERGLAFGYLREQVQNSNLMYHDIPAWYGLSGSMVGSVVEKLKVRIIGIINSANPKDRFNRMVPFTPQVLAWIKHTVDPANKVATEHRATTSVD